MIKLILIVVCLASCAPSRGFVKGSAGAAAPESQVAGSALADAVIGADDLAEAVATAIAEGKKNDTSPEEVAGEVLGSAFNELLPWILALAAGGGGFVTGRKRKNGNS